MNNRDVSRTESKGANPLFALPRPIESKAADGGRYGGKKRHAPLGDRRSS